MNLFKINRKSIRFRVTALIIILIVLQAILLSFLIVMGGVIKQAKQNAFSSFSEKVNSRRDYLQREMNFNWSNMDPYMGEIADIYINDNNPDEYLTKISSNLISMLRETQGTGAFVILNKGGTDSEKPAIYIRDYDPYLNNYGNKDLYLIYGSSKLANKLKIPLDQRWKYHIDLSTINSDFYQRPMSQISSTSDVKLLGYWSKPFQLNESDSPIITFTMPLVNRDKDVIGVIGIEVSEQYLHKMLPSTDLELEDSFGYLIGYQERGQKEITPIIMTKAIQKRVFKDQAEIHYLPDSKKEIFKLKNNTTFHNVYLSVDEIGLYQANTPFQEEHWYLVGMMREDHLFSYVRRIQSILWVATISSIVIGVIGGYIVSYRFTKPITILAKKVKDSDKSKVLELEETGLIEVDELSREMQTASNSLLESTIKMSRIIQLVGLPIGAYEYTQDKDSVFVTDELHSLLGIDSTEMDLLVQNKMLFIKKMNQILDYPDDEEEDIYILESTPMRWLKVKYIENVKSTTGVIMDITDEMIVKKQILQDRDIDTLTGIYSRKAMQDHIENALAIRDKQLHTAVLMFDLDNLKIINDTYGHKWGDIYIRHAVRHLVDMSEDRYILGRRSGDEFTVLLYNFQTRDEIRNCLIDFYTRLNQDSLLFPDGLKKQVTISSGLVWVEDINSSFDQYLQKADEALYCAKKNEKGSCYEYDSMKKL